MRPYHLPALLLVLAGCGGGGPQNVGEGTASAAGSSTPVAVDARVDSDKKLALEKLRTTNLRFGTLSDHNYGGWVDVNSTLPYDVREITLTVTYFDANAKVLRTQTKEAGPLKAGGKITPTFRVFSVKGSMRVTVAVTDFVR
jgi:hypothetical protein